MDGDGYSVEIMMKANRLNFEVRKTEHKIMIRRFTLDYVTHLYFTSTYLKMGENVSRRMFTVLNNRCIIYSAPDFNQTYAIFWGCYAEDIFKGREELTRSMNTDVSLNG